MKSCPIPVGYSHRTSSLTKHFTKAGVSWVSNFTDTPKEVITKHISTRWLSLQKCVDRILSHWNALQSYFNTIGEAERPGWAKCCKAAYCFITSFPVTNWWDWSASTCCLRVRGAWLCIHLLRRRPCYVPTLATLWIIMFQSMLPIWPWRSTFPGCRWRSWYWHSCTTLHCCGGVILS